MRKPKLLIVGAGGHGRAVAEAAVLSAQFEVAGFVDDGVAIGSVVMGFPVLGAAKDLAHLTSVCDQAIVAIGQNARREELMRQLQAAGFTLATVIHPRAFVSPSAQLGPGCAVMAGAMVGTEAHLGQGVIVNCAAVVDHHARVDDGGHLGVGACMAGGTTLGKNAWMQAGCALGYGVQVPAHAVLAPGTALAE
jgi:sugar O-acyltransferase (sialic acid O-acetyltransferase NeuD family)